MERWSEAGVEYTNEWCKTPVHKPIGILNGRLRTSLNQHKQRGILHVKNMEHIVVKVNEALFGILFVKR